MKQTLEMATTFRAKDDKTPLVLMGFVTTRSIRMASKNSRVADAAKGGR